MIPPFLSTYLHAKLSISSVVKLLFALMLRFFIISRKADGVAVREFIRLTVILLVSFLEMVFSDKIDSNSNNNELVQQNYVTNPPLLPSILSENTTAKNDTSNITVNPINSLTAKLSAFLDLM